ncbi:heterotrimeric GTP-binding alpha subunit [Crassisporium funariophilum]|nr:heterotrimeric GTP-binding alpha subunit [Crassisporium funariophilum]
MKSRDKNKMTSFYAPNNPFAVSRWSGATLFETEEEAQRRAQNMQDAVKKSKEIDAFLQEGKKSLDRRRRAVKILLLGQSESGKSSVLKNFQLAFAPKHFESERPIWKIIIQLNVIGSIKTILDALKEEYDPGDAIPVTPNEASQRSPLRSLRRMQLGLSPLFFIETNLLKLLAPECTDSRDMAVRAGNGWKTLLRSERNLSSATAGGSIGRRRSQTILNHENDPTSVLAAQRDDIMTLWADHDVQQILRKRRPRLQDSPGFFMNDIARIATINYLPTDSDILRARIRTMGVEEHHFIAERGSDINAEFFITDVGGTRNQRASWAPFFDDVQAILFLAPLAFNQTLEEDSRVNRLEDSLYLWRDICSNKLLSNANLILFFNKRDVLSTTLASGVKVNKYVPTYGDLPNDVPSVTKYFKDKFRGYHRMSDDTRPFMCYETSAIDIKSMAVLLIGVRESILRQHLRDGDMI